MKKLVITLVTVCGIALSAQIPDKPLLKVFDAAYRQDPGSNVLLSPWGIQECFGMVYGGAGKISGKELTEILGIDNALAGELRRAEELFQQSKIKFNSFNAILFGKKYTLQKSFIDYAMNQYNGKLYRVDFARAKEVADTLNDMIKRESYGMFDKVFNERTLSGDPAVVLLNVLYFKGAWSLPFEKFMTGKENFSVPFRDNVAAVQQKQVDMMNSERFVPYYNDGTLHGIVLDYKERSCGMLVLTSVKQDTPLSVVTQSLADKGVMHFVNQSSSKNKTVIKLPKLKLSGELDLKKLFTSQGMKNIFDPQLGDLTGMVEKQSLYIDQAKQLVKLNLDEEGSEVAAVTYAVMKANSAMPMKVEKNHFYADHPFVLVLFDRRTQAIILAGAITNPEAEK